MLNKSLDDPLVLQSLEGIPVYYDGFNYSCFEYGFGFVVAEGVIQELYFKNRGEYGFNKFMGELPSGIAFGDAKEIVISKLGVPNKADRNQNIDYYTGMALQFNERDELVAVSLGEY